MITARMTAKANPKNRTKAANSPLAVDSLSFMAVTFQLFKPDAVADGYAIER